MVEFCTRTSGTHLNAYDLLRDVLDCLHKAVDACNTLFYALNLMWSFVLPSGMEIPVWTNMGNAVPELPNKRFWGINIAMREINIPIPGTSLSISSGPTPNMDFALPKESIDELWHTFVRPFDYKVPGTEYWLWTDNDWSGLPDEFGGQLIPGFAFPLRHPGTPSRGFGLLADSPTLAKDLALVYYIFKIIKACGLMGLAKAFIGWLMKSRSYNRYSAVLDDLRTELPPIQNAIDDTHDDVQSFRTELLNMKPLGVKLRLL